MIQSPTCPSCGTALARGRSGDMCPACLLRAAMMGGTIRPFIDHPLPDLDEIRALFPDLEIIGLIGRGGMGAVYQVRQPTLDRFAALKILPRNLAAEPGFRERFHREARTMAALNHPNIVTIHESGERDGLFFLLMDLLAGGASLKQRDTLERSALHLAAKAGSAEVVSVLIKAGADPKHVTIGNAAGLDPAHLQLGKPRGDADDFTKLPLLMRPSKPGDHDKAIRLLVSHGMPLEQRDPKGFTPLLSAAYRGNTEAVQTFLNFGAAPDAVNNEGFNALHSAAEQGFVKVVELLLAKGAKPDVPIGVGRTAIDCATIRDHHEVVARLLDAGASPHGLPKAVTTPVATAAGHGYPKTLAILLDRGGKANSSSRTDGSTPLIGAAAGPQFINSALRTPGSFVSPPGSTEDFTQCVRLLLDHSADPKAAMNNGTTALHAAADYNATESLKLLLSAGVAVDVLDHKAFTPLHRAAQRDSVDAARVLLDRGAKPSHPLNPTSALHTAAAAGSHKVAALLLERGADPNPRDGKSITPLHWAVSMGHPEIVALLAKHKADLAARDFVYNTPLHCAVMIGKPEIVRALLEAGADPALRNIEGATALDYALTRQLDQIVAILTTPRKP